MAPTVPRGPDPGVHAAAEWLLRRLVKGERFERTRDGLKGTDHGGWSVNRQGQTMVHVRNPGTFEMGTPDDAPAHLRESSEVRHPCRLKRPFSVSAHEVTVEQLTAAHAIHPVATVQSELSLWSTDQLEEVVPWCRANGAAFIPYAPLGRGFLTGTLASATQLEGSDWRNTNPRFSSESIDANQRLVDIVRAVAARHGATPAQVALAWVLGLGDDIVPIPGTKRMRYLEENVAAVGIKLTGSDLAELSTIADRVVGTRY